MNRFPIRRSFGKDGNLIPSSNLISLQMESYSDFLQKNVSPKNRENKGLQNVLKEVLTLKDPNAKNHIEFLSYDIDEPEYGEYECVARGKTYSAAVKVNLRLIRYAGKASEGVISEIKEQSIFLCDMPLMCSNGGFVIRGINRIVVSQLHKSSGAFFSIEEFKSQGIKKIYLANIIPHRGAWLDFEIDYKGLGWAKIDKKRKISLSTFLMLVGLKEKEEGYSKQEIINSFYDSTVYAKHKHGWYVKYSEKWLKNFRPSYNLHDPNSGEIILQAGKTVTTKKQKEIEELGGYCIAHESLLGMYLANEIKIEDYTYGLGYEIDDSLLSSLTDLKKIVLLNIDHSRFNSVIRDTVILDKNNSIDEALLSFYKTLRPGEVASLEGARYLFYSTFCDPDRYDFSMVGRFKLNHRLRNYYKNDSSKKSKILTSDDVFCIVKILLGMRDGKEQPDNIDHLSCRRIRSVGELVSNQCRGALYKVAKALKDRLNGTEIEDSVDLCAIFQSKVLASSLKEFFGTSQLSQIMDNLNPLARLAHCRRITAMGRGGVVASRAADSMRDVGESYYGRLCPVESPEGQNIGLISYLSMYAKVNEYGFLQSPYKKVIDGVVQNEIVYLDAQEEEHYNIAPFTVNTDKDGKILNEKVVCRQGEDDYVSLTPSEIDYIDVASGQILSVASSLIPFIENDDPHRALMGSNMQRQAVPVKKAVAPLVGTGLESRIGVDSMMCVLAKEPGKVVYVDSSKIFVQHIENPNKIDTYFLKKYERSNSYSCINHRVIVKVGDKIESGQVLADGSSIDHGEVALGQNLRVAFMSFKGNTFEDAIVISERLLNNTLTSVRIEEVVVQIKDGESIIRSIPGVSDEFVKNLDEAGIVTVGAKVKEGEVLVGRVIPKIETISTPEEKLLKAMFGNRNTNYSDASLRVPPGCAGTVIDVKIFNKKESNKDERSLLIERIELNKLKKNRDLELKIILSRYEKEILNLLKDELVVQGNDHVNAQETLTEENLNQLSFETCKGIRIENEDKQKKIDLIYSEFKSVKKGIVDRFENLAKKISLPTELPAGVITQIKIFIATNRIIEAGDKLAGRHGNKGVVSKVLPIEDMPFDENGEPVDVILNSLGVAARMNIGQVFEIALGWVSKEIGKQVSNLLYSIYTLNKNYDDLKELLKKAYPNNEIDSMTEDQMLAIALKIANGLPFAVPSFDGAKLEDIKKLLSDWNIPSTAKIKLRDGETGELYASPITVGYMYLMKLNHMVADKIHARSTGGYSLITQQPPGGRAKMGGQRLGEMEIWALQAYGAAYLTKESMTIKSDDHLGRVSAYESMIKGQEVSMENNSPESFKVLRQELRAVMLNTDCLIRQFVEGKEAWIKSGAGSEFDALKISLMSPEQIKSYSYGEVKKAETLNYRTQKAEIGGLHCPVIFGPEKDYRCACGRYSKMKYRGIVCEKCNVEVTVSRVRRERMGHIELACPVAHIWFTKILPSSIGLMLDLTSKDLDKVLRYESYIIISAGITPLEEKQLLTEEEFDKAKQEYGSTSFVADMGAEAIEALLKAINLDEMRMQIVEQLNSKPNDLLKKKLIKKLRMVNGFIENKTRPEWMIIKTLPVLPADLRPLVALDGGRFATPDSNDLYRRIINRNNRLRSLEGFPEIVKRNEKRMIAAAVNAVIDNSRVDQPFLTSNGRPLQSIGDLLKGKQGRFRQNLLGKRVDFSGRSVIVVGPNLKLHQCGLPKKMAVELFKPLIYARLEQYGYAVTLRSAKKIVEERRPEVWEILKEVTYQYPILLNRPPTLHRLGIQAFECVLIDSNAIQLHPLVCAAFNADFDGDQMSVHVPLSVEAQIEARILMMPSNNLLSPANGQLIMEPKKDMVLGLYYLTNLVEGLGKEGIVLNQNEVEKAIEEQKIYFNQKIEVIIDCPIEGSTKTETTGGRVILYNSLPEGHKIPFKEVNKLFIGRDGSKLFEKIYNTCKRSDVVSFADTLMTLGFKYATNSCVSLGIEDLISLKEKEKLVKDTKTKVLEFDRQFKEGLITKGEKKNKIAEAWLKCDTYLEKEMDRILSKKEPGKDPNPIYMMYHSKARASTAQMKQIMSMRGFVIKPSGEWVENAIDKSYKDGLDALSYFTATHGTRKGLTDTALKTADAGYFTRKLVEVAQDCIITEKSCDINDTEENISNKYITFEPANKGGFFDYSGAEGRIIAEDIVDPESDAKILFHRYHMLTKEDLETLSKNMILSIKVRSPIMCSCHFGICATCYGLDLSKAKQVSIGEPVGVIAAQSIGEPGAQLMMRTFHGGGGSVGSNEESSVLAIIEGKIKYINAKIHKRDNGTMVLISRGAEVLILDEQGRQRSKHRMPYGSRMFFEEGQQVKQGNIICEWDNTIIPRLAIAKGYVEYRDLIEGISLKKFIDETSGLSSRIVTDYKKLIKKKNSINPAILIKDENGDYVLTEDGLPISYKLELDDVIMVENGAHVEIGDLVVKKQKMSARSSDITAGLPKLVEIFEARLPKIQAVMSEIDGTVVFNKDNKFKRYVTVTSQDGSDSKEYMISKDINIVVQSGDQIKRGDLISEGSVSSHDILRILGVEALVLYLLKSIKDIFNSQGMVVDNKHVECIIRYMLRKLEVIESKNSTYVNGEIIDILDYKQLIKHSSMDEDKVPEVRYILQGITKASSMDISFLKAASFQEPHKALIGACLSTNSIDYMHGMKEALITGNLIPAGTGVVVKQWQREFEENLKNSESFEEEKEGLTENVSSFEESNSDSSSDLFIE
ncbi:DNA-directed RNA polymerase subunit beta' [Alphaproteobacteria bacterium endosymbiont of Tiliacea citrago]|uniref:DNA-directed RNA polymerase subunit beta' n=1 Tax=Alphaproteobacteria bacterium endosymbiont of Tiliacea citrago TaxID=3077944 RepID=UPI00313BCFBB